MEIKQKAEAKSKKVQKDSKEQENNVAVHTNERNIVTRGRIFEGIVTKKFPKRIVVEFERMIYVRKYERYAKLKTKIHARVLDSMEKEVNIGDLVRVQECRPLSKIIHFVVIKKIKDVSEVNK